MNKIALFLWNFKSSNMDSENYPFSGKRCTRSVRSSSKTFKLVNITKTRKYFSRIRGPSGPVEARSLPRIFLVSQWASSRLGRFDFAFAGNISYTNLQLHCFRSRHDQGRWEKIWAPGKTRKKVVQFFSVLSQKSWFRARRLKTRSDDEKFGLPKKYGSGGSRCPHLFVRLCHDSVTRILQNVTAPK